VDRKRRRLQEERVELDDAGYLRADLRVTLLHYFDDTDAAVVAPAKAAAPAPKPVAKASTTTASSAAAAVNARAA